MNLMIFILIGTAVFLAGACFGWRKGHDDGVIEGMRRVNRQSRRNGQA